MAEGGSPGPAVVQGPPDLIPDIIPVDLGQYRVALISWFFKVRMQFTDR